MMLANLFGSVLSDLEVFSPAESNSSPTGDWTVEQTIRLLQQYPSGVSRPVLLTELEHRWRLYLKRGEHVGKLKQAIVTKQLSLADTFTGDLSPIDEYRCTFSADGVSCTMILHRQWFDWMMFLQSVGVESVNGRRCLFTQCRMLKLSPPVLLPTPMSVVLLRLSDALEGFLVQDVFSMMQDLFAARFIDPHVHIRTHLLPSHVPVCKETHGCAGSDQVTLPDNSETLVVCAEVVGCSSVRQYQQSAQQGGGGGGGAQYQLITLRLPGSSGSSSNNNSTGTSTQQRPSCIAYLILFDDQVALSRLWKQNDQLILYRPYLRANAEEERLFGTNRAVEHSSLAHAVVARPEPCLFEHLPVPGAEAFANYHMLYGSVTVICKIEAEGMGSGLVAGVAPPRSSSATLSVGDRGVSAMGTVLSLRSLPLSVTAPPNSSTITGSDLSGGVLLEMWLHCAAAPATKSSPARLSQLLRIRGRSGAFFGSSRESALNACPPSPGPVTTESAQAGQAVYLRGGLTVLSACPLSLVVDREEGSGAGGVPANQVRSWAACLGSDAVTVLNCALGAGTNLFQDEVQSVGGTSEKVVVDADSGTSADDSCCKIVPVCCLPALACSPSLFLPTPIVAAVGLVTGPSSASGCVLVQASIQPMHPSVRLLPLPPATGSDSAVAIEAAGNSHGKRQRTEGVEGEVAGSSRTEQGYQLMRLRDGSGEVLCVIESTVEQSVATGELSAVRHRLVNTSSTLFFDSVTGQLVRAPTAAAGGQALPTGTAAVTPSGPTQYAMLLSRIDDPAVESPLLHHLRSQQQQQQSKNGRGNPLPVFRIETICDALPSAAL